MSCGCASHASSTADPRPAFAMCWACPSRTRCGTFAELTAGGKPFNPIGRTCPRNRWPDSFGMVRYWLVSWYGVPFPVRLRLAAEGAWLAFRQRMGDGYLPGCGCVASLRNLWDAFFGAPSFPPVVIDSGTFNLYRSAA